MAKGRLGRVLALCGSCVAFYIGAGFATMQEVMQYEASYGSLFWLVIVVAAAIYIYTNLSFAANGNRLGLERGGDIYTAYCGKYVGSFFDFFAALFCYMSFVVMCGGANSTAMQQWGLPNGVGAIVLAAIVCVTVLFGLEGILNSLSKIGPIIIIAIIVIAGVSVIAGATGFLDGLKAVDSGQYELEQIGSGNPISSGISYGGFVILWFAAFWAEVGGKNTLREVNAGMLLSAICIFGVAALCCVALISNIGLVWDADIPALSLAGQIHPAFALIFAVIIFAGIYTSAVPLLWTGVRKLSDDGTRRYKILTVVGSLAGCVIACLVPYAPLLNVLYGLNGYLGFVLIVFMIVNDVRVYVLKKHGDKKIDAS